MQELRFVAVSEDGSYAVLAVPGRSGRYILPIDERLRAVAQGQTSRLAQYEIEVESPLRPKEIQARIRAGETAEEIADAAGIPVERVRWFEGPVLAERAYIADQAQAGSVRRAGDSSGPGPRLGDIVTVRLSAGGTDPEDGQWDSRKRGDGNWQVSLTFPSGGRLHTAEWVFDVRRRHVMPDDDNAARLSLPESELPPEPVAIPGEATVTPIASRLGAAAGMGGGYTPAPGMSSRFRPERSVIPDRSLGADRSLADRPVTDRPLPAPAAERPAVPDRAAAPERPAMTHGVPSSPVLPPRPAQPERPSQPERSAYQGRPGSYDYVEFPESPPYRVPETPAAPAAAHDPAPYRAPVAEPPAYREPAAAAQPPAPAYRDAQPPAGPAASSRSFDDSERARVTPPAAAVFADPEPAPPARPQSAPAAVAPPVTAPANAQPDAGRVTPQPATTVASSAVTVPGTGSATAGTEPQATPAPAAASTTAAAAAGPAATAAPVTPATPAPPVAATPATAPPATAPATAAPGPATAAVPQSPAATSPEATDAADEPAFDEAQRRAADLAAAVVAAAERAAPSAAAAEQAATPEVPATAKPAAAPEAPPAAQPAAAARGSAAAEPKTEVPAPVETPAAETPAAEDQTSRGRTGAKKNAKGRRSSVPSWDEIMLGSSRQRE
jgi:Protein of unknown function (DUF3071)